MLPAETCAVRTRFPASGLLCDGVCGRTEKYGDQPIVWCWSNQGGKIGQHFLPVCAGLTGVDALGMPLDADDGQALVGNGLDTAVQRTERDCGESFSQLAYGLMVGAVYDRSGAIESMQPGIFGDYGFVVLIFAVITVSFFYRRRQKSKICSCRMSSSVSISVQPRFISP